MLFYRLANTKLSHLQKPRHDNQSINFNTISIISCTYYQVRLRVGADPTRVMGPFFVQNTLYVVGILDIY